MDEKLEYIQRRSKRMKELREKFSNELKDNKLSKKHNKINKKTTKK